MNFRLYEKNVFKFSEWQLQIFRKISSKMGNLVSELTADMQAGQGRAQNFGIGGLNPPSFARGAR